MTTERIRVDPGEIEAIREWPVPVNVTVKKFPCTVLVLSQVYLRFCETCATIKCTHGK